MQSITPPRIGTICAHSVLKRAWICSRQTMFSQLIIICLAGNCKLRYRQ